MGNNNKYIKEGFIYAGTKYIITFIGFFKSMLIAKYLGPTMLGSYAYIMLIVEYFSYYNLGVFSSMNREASIYKDKRKTYTNQIMNVSITFSLLLGFPLLLIFLGLGKLPTGVVSADIFQYRYHVFSLVILNQFRFFFIRYFRLFEKYYLLSIFELISNLIMLLGIIFFVNKYFLDAAIYIAILANLVVVIIGVVNVRDIRFYWDNKIVKYLIIVGIPMVLYTLSDKIFTTVDRVMIAQFLPRSDLGYYQFGNTLALSVMILIDSLAFIFYPKILKSFHYKSKKELESKQKSLLNILYYMEYSSTLLVTIGILIFPFFITFIMPQYIKSIMIVKLLLIAFSFKPVIFLASSFLIANDKQIKLIPITFVSLILLVTMNYIVLSIGLGINGLVIATAVGFALYSIIIYLNIFKKFNSLLYLWRQYIYFLISALIIFLELPLYFIILLWLILYFSRTRNIISQLKINFIG